MKLSKNFYLIMAIISVISLTQTWLNSQVTHTFLSWEINIWLYRLFKFSIALLFIKTYYTMKHNAARQINCK